MPEEATRPQRKFSNININDIKRYRLPVPGIVSILHRVSGLLLFLLLPLVLFITKQSLLSEVSYNNLRDYFDYILVKLFFAMLLWAFLHHLFAGIRYLFLDLHFGVNKAMARRSAKWVLAVSLSFTLLFTVFLFI